MCLELVRTRSFSALLSDEVFADVDLETLQVRGRGERRQVTIASHFVPAEEGIFRL